MPRVTYFYATAGDFITLMQTVEAELTLIYLSLPDRRVPQVAICDSVTTIPHLLTCAPGHFIDQHYIVPPGTQVVPVPFENTAGPMYRLSPQQVPSAVVLQLTGAHPSGALLRSRWWLHGPARASDTLSRAMSRHARRMFIKTQGALLGPEAYAQLQAGRRLATDAQAPEGSDVRPT